MGEVQSHEEGLAALRGEGEELKGQGTPDDQKRVDLWVEDLAQRLDELGGAIDDRQVCIIIKTQTVIGTNLNEIELSLVTCVLTYKVVQYYT